MTEQLTTKQRKALIKKLRKAYYTCVDCGEKYGEYSVGCSSMHMGWCDVCEQEKIVTETRDFAYFITGITKLQKGNS